MVKRILLFLLLIITVSCVTTSNIPSEISSQITDNANVIKIYSSTPPSDFYRTSYRSIASQGFSFAQENDEMGTFSTEFKEIGQGTALRINVFIEESESGSIAILRGLWNVTASTGFGIAAATGGSLGGSAEEANWGKSGRPKIAFGEMAVIANNIDNMRIEYLLE